MAKTADPNKDDRSKGKGGARDPYRGWRAILNPVWCYNGFVTSVMATTVFGLMMVFSSSSVDLVAQGSSPWSQVIRQAIYCLVGLACAFVAQRIKVESYQRWSMVFLVFSQFTQLLTRTPLGRSANGNQGWISIGGISMQPAEMLKLALCIWLPQALIVAQHEIRDGKDPTHPWTPYLKPIIGFVLSFGLIMLGKDLGTAMIIVIIGFVAFLVSGFPLKWLLSLAALGLAGIVGFSVMGNGNRTQRILAAYGECSADDIQGVCYQSIHGLYAMASGGLTGVGLGNSREKWNYLPEAHNDFIFAVIGEELGFFGAVLVIVAFIAMGWCMLRIALTTENRYAGMVLVCLDVWLVGQALINICVVLGLLPVIGLPLPFVSAGGTALIMCLVSAGVALSMIRTQPDVNAIATGE